MANERLLKKQIQLLSSIKSNLQFFAWLAIISLTAGGIAVIASVLLK